MAKPTQTELMNAHKLARNSAMGEAKDTNSLRLTKEVISQPLKMVDDAHPFSGNENNRRVAERMAGAKAQSAAPEAAKTSAQAAAEAIAKAAAYEKANPEEFPTRDASSSDAASLALITAGIAPTGSPTVLQPIVPVAPPAPPVGSEAPPPPPPPPSFQG